MRRREVIDRIKVGIFVIIGVILISALIFYIGSNQQVFGKKKRVEAIFKDVSGLKKGNAVRFSGVVIGKVEAIKILGDSVIQVTLGIDEEAIHFIKKDALGVISTEGLLGSKYIKITAGSEREPGIADGDTIKTESPFEIERLFKTLNDTGDEAKEATSNLNQITKKINSGEGTIGALIADKEVYNNIESMASSFAATGKKSQELTGKMIRMVDTLQSASQTTAEATKYLKEFTYKLSSDSSTLGKFIADTTMAKKVDQTLTDLDKAASDVTQTSQKVRESWLLRIFSKNKKKNNNNGCKKGENC